MNDTKLGMLLMPGPNSPGLIVKAACAISDTQKLGGYLCITDAIGNPLFVGLVGDVPESDLKMYFKFSLEKARRLALNSGHVSSWESRDISQDLYGGAIRHGAYILSFSGLPEHLDEACVVALAVMRLGMSIVDMDKIKGISNNPHINALFNKVHETETH